MPEIDSNGHANPIKWTPTKGEFGISSWLAIMDHGKAAVYISLTESSLLNGIRIVTLTLDKIHNHCFLLSVSVTLCRRHH